MVHRRGDFESVHRLLRATAHEVASYDPEDVLTAKLSVSAEAAVTHARILEQVPIPLVVQVVVDDDMTPDLMPPLV